MDPKNSDDGISLKDMQYMLEEEIAASNKAAELRIAEFSTFTKAYAAGELTPEQATDKYFHFVEKWGDAIPGVTKVRGVSDADLLKAVEADAGPHTTIEETRRAYERTTGKKSR